ncbi:hypothetical protein J6590_039520 [Homalodisca vitripennis]|nr:hypothetical protein J6590_039520 [Homalodisca vitripennis]
MQATLVLHYVLQCRSATCRDYKAITPADSLSRIRLSRVGTVDWLQNRKVCVTHYPAKPSRLRLPAGWTEDSRMPLPQDETVTTAS